MKQKLTYCILITIAFLLSCTRAEDRIAVLWTSCPEFARYCELFNRSQSKYKIVARYVANPSLDLLETDERPDVVVGSWLKGAEVRKKFISLNSLLKETAIDPDIFYPELLNLGKSDSKQMLLPVSFNLPALIFRKDAIQPTDDFTISLDEIQKLSTQYTRTDRNGYTYMGFAPRWDTEFLYLTAKGYNATFEEQTGFFSWSETSLKNAVTALRSFTLETNTSTKAETDFQFKYLYNNAYTAITSGRCLFQYLRSDDLLQLDQDKMASLDFRWLAFNKRTPLDDEVVYAGIYTNGRNKDCARAFLTFLFSVDTQKHILLENSQLGISSMGFGIAGGFSSIRSITENIFPTYYPALLFHLPQSSGFMSPHVLPSNWLDIKKEIIIPYLKVACEIDSDASISEFTTLGNYINLNKSRRE